MPIRLDTSAPDFAASFKAFLATKREISEDVEQAVRAIIADVAARGDQALVELTRRFDRFDPEVVGLRFATDEIESALARCDRAALDALTLARDRIEVGAEREDTDPSSIEFFNEQGLATVDSIDQLPGKVALVLALDGADGNFGVKDTADSLLPDLIEPSPTVGANG